MAQETTQKLYFNVSSGLKSVLGRELITDDEVAIFELVKNSFDARAKRVDIYFGADTIVVADDGIGMSFEDIQTTWLFVAYSAKRSSKNGGDFRENIAERNHYAGSKGIGRFSSDRLGQVARLQTRPKDDEGGPVHSITIDWSRFDEDRKTHFSKVQVAYALQPSGFVLLEGLPILSSGTVISIERTRQIWDRDKILRLKSALAKLINPFGAAADGFRIWIHAPAELTTDASEQLQIEKRHDEFSPNKTVNGEVGNFIFSTLQEKTTLVSVRIDSAGYVESILVDRGELIYRIHEPNRYPLLADSGFQCQVYYLNLSAKVTFAKRMGVPSVRFGSVFVFRNGFRVFPIGNEGDDWFGIDRRKQQGFRRFLGTRDVIGRIDVAGTDESFQEASSRNAGLIETLAVAQLRKCFIEMGIKRLERYVVPVTFVDKEDKNTSDISRLLTDPGRARVTSAVAKLVDSKEIELLEYSKRLISILDEQSAQFEDSLSSLRAIAAKTSDSRLLRSINQAELRFDELRKSAVTARRQADEERSAKAEAEARAGAAEMKVKLISEELAEEKKRSLFLTSLSIPDKDTILNLHHQVTIYAVDIQQHIENLLIKISGKELVSGSEVLNAVERIALLNRKVMGIAKFATRANFRLESEKIEADMAEYIEQYINDVARDFLHGPMVVTVESDAKGFLQKFKPIDISVMVDNLIANARKAGARKVTFEITHPSRNTIYLNVNDDGRGFNERIQDLGRVFEKGFTTTDGSGLGLYHVRQVLGEMNGTIEVVKNTSTRGAAFLIRISK